MELTPSDASTIRRPQSALAEDALSSSQSPPRQQLGKYRLVRLLAQGGFAEVYLGEHIHLNTLDAIKVLHTHVDSSNIEEFRKEARIVARLRHPHIIYVHDFDVEENTPFLVMDYASNGTLRQRHPKGSALQPATIASYIRQIGEALQYAHAQRLIHRDIKPENMLLDEQERVMLSDFGIALFLSAQTQAERDIVGTISYMAPEQLQGRPVLASDQYGLGVVVYEWLCGECPFRGSMAEVAAQHMNTPPPSLCERAPGFPSELEAVVFKALAKDPAERYPSIMDFVYAFEAACSALLLHLPLVPVRTNGLVELQDAHEAHEFYESPTLRATEPAVQVWEHPALPALPETSQVRKPRVSRRVLLVGITGLAVLGAVGGGASWIAGYRPFSPSRVTPKATPSLTPLGTTFHTYRGHHDIVNAIACSANGSLIASASNDTTVQVWDTSTGGVNAASYTGHNASVLSVGWSPDSKFVVSGGADNTARVWNTGDGSNPVTYTGHSAGVNTVALSPDGQLAATGSDDKTVQLWHPSDGSNVLAFTGHTDAVKTTAWSPASGGQQLIASGSADSTIQVWSTANTSHPFTYTGHAAGVNAVAWSPDGTLIASASDDKTVRVWKATTGELVAIYGGHSDVVNAVAWSFDGSLLASASADKTVQVWRARDGSNPYVYRGHSAPVHTLAWIHSTAFIASAGEDTTVQIWLATL